MNIFDFGRNGKPPELKIHKPEDLPPKPPPTNNKSIGFMDDEIEKIGDQIAKMGRSDAAKLNKYLEYFYNIKVRIE